MRADIHGGPEQKLQSEAGYIDARPQTDSSTKTSCNARPDHTSGSKGEILTASRYFPLYTPRPDMAGSRCHVCFVLPKADSCTAANSISIRSPRRHAAA